MLLVPIRIASIAPITFVHLINMINECVSSLTFFLINFSTTFYVSEMNNLLCSLAHTWPTIIDYKYYVIDSLSCEVSV